MHAGVPVWFYAFDAPMYFIDALVGFLLSFYFYRMFSISSEKKHMYLHLGFLLLSIGLSVMSISGIFSYVAYVHCGGSFTSCIPGLQTGALSLEDFSYIVYFGFSIFAYFLFILVYAEEYLRFSKIFVASFLGYLFLAVFLLSSGTGQSIWSSDSTYFHLTSFIMLLFISFKNIIHYTETKRMNALLVASSFILISLSHLFHLFLLISGLMYVLGHIFMLLGFVSLFLMIIRVMKLSFRFKVINRFLNRLGEIEKKLGVGDKKPGGLKSFSFMVRGK